MKTNITSIPTTEREKNENRKENASSTSEAIGLSTKKQNTTINIMKGFSNGKTEKQNKTSTGGSNSGIKNTFYSNNIQ